MELAWDPVSYSSVSVRDSVTNTQTRGFIHTSSTCTATGGVQSVVLGTMKEEEFEFEMDAIRWSKRRGKEREREREGRRERERGREGGREREREGGRGRGREREKDIYTNHLSVNNTVLL